MYKEWLKDMKKIAEETSTTVDKMEGTILTASTNNRTINTTNLIQIADDLWYLIQSDIDDRVLEIQRMLVDELNQYKGKENDYMKENIWEIQELYIKEENGEEKGKVEDEEVILIKALWSIHDNIVFKYKFHNRWSQTSIQAHEICTNAIPDQTIQTTTTLSISQI